MKHLKTILVVLYGVAVFSIIGALFYLALKAKFHVFFTSWAFIWRARRIIEYAKRGLLLVTIICIADFARRKDNVSETLFVKHLIHFFQKNLTFNKRETYFMVLAITMFLFTCLALIEAGLRGGQIYSSKAEKLGSPYTSPYDASYEKGWLHVFTPHEKFERLNGEFPQIFITNSQGFVDQDWLVEKKYTSVRIACIGDSYTQGIGAPIDSSYPAILRKLFLADTEVINFGIGGSDPVFEYMILKQKALSYSPDIVTLAVNVSDIDDVVVKGGMERFANDGSTHFRNKPWWEEAFAHIYLVRILAIDGFDINWGTHLPQKQMAKEEAKAMTTIENVLDSANALCAARHIRFIIIFNPLESELKEGKMKCDPIRVYCEKKGYEVLNVLNAFRDLGMNSKNAGDYFWPIDEHNKPMGYAQIAIALKKQIEDRK